MAKKFNNNVKVALTNLGKYTEGELSFVWLDLPATDEEIAKAYDIIGIDGVEYEETFITDYEAPFTINEYDSLTELNEMAEAMGDLYEYEVMAFVAYIDEMSDDVGEALELAQSSEYTVWDECYDMEDVAMAMIDAGYFEIDENNPLHRYIDYTALARDLEIEGTFVFLDGGNCVELHG